MGIERRKDERKNFLMDKFKGSFFIQADDQYYEVSYVQDVSISGIGLDIKDVSYEPGHKIDLIFEVDGLRISIAATVRWADQYNHDQQNLCRVGLEFDQGQGDMTLLFFMALREYLDSFDAERVA